jgi:protein-S-isoprenylcysteine O-methyltransferase Ste14
VPEAAFAGPEWLWVAVGCGVGCFGLCLRRWAIRVFGTQFTRNLQVIADHQLVTNGPYRTLRHPSYTGAVLMFVGVGIGLVNALSFAACLVCASPKNASNQGCDRGPDGLLQIEPAWKRGG